MGDDFLQYPHGKRVVDEIRKEDPFCMVLSPPCTMFSQMRRSTGDSAVERKKVREAIILLNYAIEICEDRMKQGKYFLFEHPQGARSWRCKKMMDLLKPQVGEVVLDMCQYGMCDRVNGKPHEKSTQLVGNLQADVMQGLHRRCTNISLLRVECVWGTIGIIVRGWHRNIWMIFVKLFVMPFWDKEGLVGVRTNKRVWMIGKFMRSKG